MPELYLVRIHVKIQDVPKRGHSTFFPNIWKTTKDNYTICAHVNASALHTEHVYNMQVYSIYL